MTLRGDWSNLISTSDYVKIYCRESRVGNKALYAGQHGYRWDGGFVTVDSVRYRLPNLYWVHHRAYNTDWAGGTSAIRSGSSPTPRTSATDTGMWGMGR